MDDLPQLVSNDELESLDGDINPHDLAPYNYPGGPLEPWDESDDESDADSDEESDTDSDEGFDDEYDSESGIEYEHGVTPPSGVPELDRTGVDDIPMAENVHLRDDNIPVAEDVHLDLPEPVSAWKPHKLEEARKQLEQLSAASQASHGENVHLGADGRDHGVIPQCYDHGDHGDHGAIPPSLDDEVLSDVEGSGHEEAPPNDDEELKSDIDSTQSFCAAELEFAVIKGAAEFGSGGQLWTSANQWKSKEPAEIAEIIIAKHISISACHTERIASLGVQPSELARNLDSWRRKNEDWVRVKPWLQGEHRTNKDLKIYWDIHQKLKLELDGLMRSRYRLNRAHRLRPGEDIDHIPW